MTMIVTERDSLLFVQIEMIVNVILGRILLRITANVVVRFCLIHPHVAVDDE